MPESVFVLTDEPYHDNSTVCGVYSTLERAWKAAVALATVEPDKAMEIRVQLSEWLLNEPGPAVAWRFARDSHVCLLNHKYKPGKRLECGGYKRLPFASETQGLWVGRNRNLHEWVADGDFELPSFVKGENIAQV